MAIIFQSHISWLVSPTVHAATLPLFFEWLWASTWETNLDGTSWNPWTWHVVSNSLWQAHTCKKEDLLVRSYLNRWYTRFVLISVHSSGKNECLLNWEVFRHFQLIRLILQLTYLHLWFSHQVKSCRDSWTVWKSSRS